MIFPNSAERAKAHLRMKREREVSLAMSAVSDLLQRAGRLGASDFAVMEFGCGDGFQIPHLRKFGKVSASDLYTSDGIRVMKDLEFYECRIERTPFKTGQFDLIYSNQVFQDIPEAVLPEIYLELKRILKAQGLLAFTVPTNHWLLFRIPAHYWNNFRFVWKRVVGKDRGAEPGSSHFATETSGVEVEEPRESKFSKALKLLLPSGIGGYPGFWNAYRKMSVKSWTTRFEKLGFEMVEVKPLLIYSPSEWPLVPTMKPLGGVCSSVLIVLRIKM